VLTSLAGGSIVAERFGDGPATVIALHGWGRTGHDFAPVLDGMNGLAVHLPGFGPAPAPDTAWSPADYATWLAKGIDPGSPPIILGHSFGGRVAVRLATHYPDLVGGLVLTGVPFGRLSAPRKAPVSLRLAKAARKVGWVSEARVESLRRRYGSTDYRAADGVMRDVLVTAVNEDYFHDLAGLSQPTRLVWGEGDGPAPVALAEKADAIIPRSTLTVVRGSGHLLDGALHEALREAISELTHAGSGGDSA
jgi:pimeloyl-ACP methyl ester carboxylesterase